LSVVIYVSIDYRTSPFGFNIVRHREVQHRINNVLVLFLGNLGDGQVLIPLFEVWTMHLASDEFRQLPKQEVARLRASIVLLAERRTDLRIGQLSLLFLNRARSGFPPCRTVIKQVPVLEGQTVGCPRRDGLPKHPSALLVSLG